LSDTEKELILVVDDESTARLLLKNALQKEGFRVATAKNGEEAVLLAKSLLPSTMLVDAMMPGMDGFEVCKELKSIKLTSNIPIIMVTSLSDVSDLQKGFESGALDYIRKPFNPHEMLIRLRNALALKKTQEELQRRNKKLLQELDLAEALQRRLLFIPPLSTETYALNSFYCPSVGVSGDVFDQFIMPNGNVCIYLADVCGHGVAASLVSSLIKAVASETIQAGFSLSPAALCNNLDSSFRKFLGDYNTYATLFLGIYDPVNKIIKCMNCGHPSPIIVDASGAFSAPFDEKGGMPLGFSIAKDIDYCEEDELTIEIKEGDHLFIYSDGLIEAVHKDSATECGIDGLGNILAKVVRDYSCLSHRTAELVYREIKAANYDVSEDDCSVMVLNALKPEEMVYKEKFDPTLSCIQTEVEAIEDRMVAQGWTIEDAWAIRLMLTEYLNNVAIHGTYECDALDVTVRACGSQCVIKVVYDGVGTDIESLAKNSEMPDVAATGGRGIPIINTIASRINYYKHNETNIVFFVVDKNVAVDMMNSNESEKTEEKF